MTNLLRAELRKLTTIRTTLGLLAALLALTLASAALVLAEAGQAGAAPPGSTESIGRVLSVPGSDALVVLLGVLIVTGEYRHRTATAAFLLTPHRHRVITAKLAAAALAGILAAAASTLAGLALTLPWLYTSGAAFDADVAAVTFGAVAKTAHLALYAMLGVGIGALMRNQIAAALTALLWLYAVEPLFIGGTFPDLVRWLPTGAAIALARGQLHGTVVLPPWVGALLLLAYALVLAGLGARVIVRHDLT